MKRTFPKVRCSFLVGLCVTTMLSTSYAFAADFTHCADDLATLGIFKGGTTGYELDRAPTRAEAATMLVRLLGKEEAALASTYTAPFTDVPAWAQPYVGWLYENDMTQGMTATTYSPSTTCTAQMFATFCLRALGYSDTHGDFTYAAVLDFAKEVGVIDDTNCNLDVGFLRDNLAAVSLTTLNCQTKNTNQTLLTQLTNQGAISRTAAQELLNRFALYNTYAASVERLQSDIAKQSVSLTDLYVYQNGILLDSSHMETKSTAMYNPSNRDQSMLSAITSIDYMQVSEFYYRDGIGYRSLYGQTSQHAMPYESAIDGLDEPKCIPICSLTDLYTREESGETYYTLQLDPATSSKQLRNTADSLGFADALQAEPNVDSLSYDVVIDIDGNMCKQILLTEFSLVVQEVPTTAKIKMTTYLSNYGQGVVVEYPDDLAEW